MQGDVAGRQAGGAGGLRAPPTVQGFPLVGSIPQLIRGKLDYLAEARARYGDLFTLDLGVGKAVVLGHPRLARQVLRDNARNYRKGGAVWDAIRALMGNGLTTSDGDFWLRQRRMIQPQFHRERLAAMAALMLQAIDEGMAHWDAAAAAGTPLDLERELLQITMKIIVKTMFGSGLHREEADEVAEQMAYTLGFLLKSMLTQSLPKWVPIPGRRRFLRAVQTIDRIVFAVIERHRREEGAPGGDLIALLQSAVDAETGERMTDQQLRDEAVSMFLAGYETTNTAVGWAFHALLQRPELYGEVEREVDGALGARAPGFADLPQLGLVSRVLQESLRLFPVVYSIPRVAVEDDELDGFRIPAGTTVAALTYLIHRHPDLWEEPLRFDPGRFTPERSAGREPLAWMPFGAGQRLCIGKEFAMMEGQLILARALQRYRLEPIPGRVTRAHVATTLQTRGGIWVKPVRRAPRPEGA